MVPRSRAISSLFLATVLLHPGTLRPRVSALLSSFTDIPGVLNPFLLSAAARATAVHPAAVLKPVFLSAIVRGYITVVVLAACRVTDTGICVDNVLFSKDALHLTQS